jgi:transcriptional regulator with XRE-family HTH domain
MTTQPETSEILLTVRHRQLCAELERLRKGRELSQADAAAAVGISRQRYGRIETGAAQPRQAELGAILDFLGCEQALRLALLDVAKNLNVRGLWTAYDDVVSVSFADIEQRSVRIKSYQTWLVPGLLQTPEYTLALVRLGQSDDELQLRQVAARASRRRRLAEPEGPVFHAIVAESVLHRPIGGPEVLSEQLRALVTASTRPNIKLQIMPTAQWEHPGHEGSFVLFEFGGPQALDLAYLEGVGGTSLYLEKANQVERCSVNFEQLSKVALSESESVSLIEGLLL